MLKIIHEEAGVTLAELGPVFIWGFRSQVVKDWMLRCRDPVLDLAKRHPNGIGMVTIIASTVPAKMDAETRDTATRITKEVQALLRFDLTLLEGTGFWAAATRSILSGINFVGGVKCPHVVVGAPGEALDWMAAQKGFSLPPRAELEDALRRVREGR